MTSRTARWHVEHVDRHPQTMIRLGLDEPSRSGRPPWPLARVMLWTEADPDTGEGDEEWQFRLWWAASAEETGFSPWSASGRLTAGAGSWTVTALEIAPTAEEGLLAPSGGITARVLRQVPLGLVHDALYVLSVPQVLAADELRSEPSGLGEMIRRGLAPPRAGVGGVPGTLGHEVWLSVYFIHDEGIEWLTAEAPTAANGGAIPDWPRRQTGKLGRPRRSERELAAFAEDFLAAGGNYREICTRRGIPFDTAKDWVRACRKAELLAPGVPGRRGAARPGPRLIEMREGTPR